LIAYSTITRINSWVQAANRSADLTTKPEPAGDTMTNFIFYPPLNPLPSGDFSNSPLERGRGVFVNYLVKKD